MLEIHTPHRAAHTWADFFIHIATIVIGLCIAVGLEQSVEFFHHRHQVAEIRASLRVERAINVHTFGIATEEFHRFVPKLERNLAIFRFLQQHPGAPAAQWPGKLSWLGNNIYYNTDAWDTAQRSGILQYMPRDEVRLDADLYDALSKCMQATDRARDAKYEAMRFGNVDADAAHLSREQLAREIDLTSEALMRYGIAANSQYALALGFADFKPAPSIEEVQRLSGVTWDDDDLAAIADQDRRMDDFARGQSAGAGPAR